MLVPKFWLLFMSRFPELNELIGSMEVAVVNVVMSTQQFADYKHCGQIRQLHRFWWLPRQAARGHLVDAVPSKESCRPARAFPTFRHLGTIDSETTINKNDGICFDVVAFCEQ